VPDQDPDPDHIPRRRVRDRRPPGRGERIPAQACLAGTAARCRPHCGGGTRCSTRDLIEKYLTGGGDDAAAHRTLGHLTHREREVLPLIGQGRSNQEIAGRLVIAESTAKTYVKRTLAKIDARDGAQAVVFAYRSGLVSRFD
jgi:DNA-binding CsgD family transcriptional regulator